MMFGGFLSATIVAVCIAFPAVAEPLPKALQPEEVGLSTQRLKILDAAFQSEVDSEKIPGASSYLTQWQSRLLGRIWVSRSREAGPYEGGCNLPDRLHDKAACISR